MRITVLGCAGSIARGNATTAFQVDDDLLIDMGTGVGSLTLEQMSRIDHVLLSHSHLDHVLALPLLADTVMQWRVQHQRPPIQVYALQPTLQTLRQHLFNEALWPDFTRIPSAEHPVISLQAVQCGDVLSFGQRRVHILPAAHSVAAIGFALAAHEGADAPKWVYTGDTGPNPQLWPILRQWPVRDLVIEVAFADADAHVAVASAHLHPKALGHELQALDSSVAVHLTHIKPGDLERVQQEVAALNLPHRICALRPGDTFTL